MLTAVAKDAMSAMVKLTGEIQESMSDVIEYGSREMEESIALHNSSWECVVRWPADRTM